MVPAGAARPPRPKNTLFCPSCGHESPSDGDWQVRSGGALCCPACGATVTRRPVPGPAEPLSERASSTLAARAQRLAVGLLRVTAGSPPRGRPL